MPVGEGVPEVSGGFRDGGVRDGAASGDAGPGTGDFRGEAGL